MNKLCIIMNKPCKRLNNLIARTANESCVIYSCVVYDMNCQSLRIRKHDDELYMFGKRLRTDTTDYVDCHEFYPQIPAERYIYVNKHPMIHEDVHLEDYDTIIVMPDSNDFESYLAIAAFFKDRHYDPSRTIRCLTLDGFINTEHMLIQFLAKEDGLPYFETEFAKLFNEREKETFISHFPISRDIRYLQAETHMTNIEFANFFGTSVRNVENWRQNPESLKDFIYDLFEYKLLKEGII